MAKFPLPRPRFAGRAAAILLAATALGTAPALAQDTFSLRGMITAHDGDKLTVRTSDGSEHFYTLTPSTRVVEVFGRFNLQSKNMAQTDLIEGLAVTVDGQAGDEEMTAVKVTFRDDDFKTAQQISAGTAEARARVKAKAAELEAKDAEMKKRLSEANQYVEKGSTTVYFATGSTAIDAESRAKLQGLCIQAQAIKGYWIGVTGHADSTGDPQKNQVLSEKRANAVIRFVQKSCNVQPHRILSGAAMGDVKPASAEPTPQGFAQNRRVVVQILVNKGLEGL